METVRVLVKKPQKEATEMEIEHSLKSFQEIVDGHIQAIRLPSNIYVIVNEEGKLMNLEKNIVCPEYWDIFVGSVFFIGTEGSEFRSLTDEEMQEAKDYCELNAI